MDSKALLAYRKQIIDDAIRMKKPDRTPHFANYWTWKILDAGYKIGDALRDWNILEDCVIKFQQKYNFDCLCDDGVRNPILVAEALGSSSYEIDDAKEIMNIRDVSYMTGDDYDALMENFPKFLWEVLLPRKFERFNSELGLAEFGKVIGRFNEMGAYLERVSKNLNEAYGLPHGLMTSPMVLSGFEMFFNYYRGIKGLSMDLRKCPDKVIAACDFLDAMNVSPVLQNLKNTPKGELYAVDLISALLGYTILSPKQWEKFYWPMLKKVIDAVVEADKTLYIFAEGSCKRFWSYFKDIPAGHIAIHIEQDDVFEFREALPNICVVGGMPTSLLGGGTAGECVAYAKRLIDELGSDGGFILSQDKMISYRNDTKPENLKAVCDFVNDYR